MAASEKGGVSLCDGEGRGSSPDEGCVVKALSVGAVAVGAPVVGSRVSAAVRP